MSGKGLEAKASFAPWFICHLFLHTLGHLISTGVFFVLKIIAYFSYFQFPSPLQFLPKNFHNHVYFGEFKNYPE